MGLARGLAAVVGLLACTPQPSPPLSPPRVAASPAAVGGGEPCGAGLLCEDPQTHAGFRVPAHCEVLHAGALAWTCRVEAPGIDQQVREFMTSRYAAAKAEGPGVWSVQAPQGELRVIVRGDRAEFAVLPAAGAQD